MQKALADFLADVLGRPIRDATGLRRRYDFSLVFVMEPGGRAAGPLASDAPESEAGESLIDAVKSQLGLGLRRTHGDVQVLVVDSAGKTPAANQGSSGLLKSLIQAADEPG